MDAFGAWLVWLVVAIFGAVGIGSADGLTRRTRKVLWTLWAIWVAPVAISGFLIVCTLIGAGVALGLVWCFAVLIIWILTGRRP